MICYYLMLFLLIIGFLNDFFKTKYRNIIYKINFSLLFIFASFRYSVGADYFPYQRLFSSSIPLSEITKNYFIKNINNIEYGYLFLESLVKQLTNNYQILLVIMNLCMFFFLHQGIKQHPYKNIQLFIFYCFIYLFYITSTYRQGLAMMILYYNLKNIKRKKFFQYIILCLIASLFHRISFLMIPIYFFIHKKYSRKFFIFILLIVFIFENYFIMEKLLEYLDLKFNNVIINRVYHYFIIKKDGNVSLLGYVQRLSLFFVIIIFKNKIPNYLNNLLILCPISFFVLSSLGGVIAGRISGFFLIFYMSYFSILFFRIKKLNKVLVGLFLITYGTLMFNRELYTINPVNIKNPVERFNYLPYKNIITK